MALKRKGIYCIEANWSNDPKNLMSVAPMLELLSQVVDIPYYHRDAVNADAATALLQQWCLKRFDSYPVLWLACHGSSGMLHFMNDRKNNGRMSIDKLEEVLAAKGCGRSLIYFGSCSVLRLNGNRWQRFLRNTGALAVCGYREDVDWIDSAAFELLLLTQMQNNALTRGGAKAMKRNICKDAGKMAKDLGFAMFIRGNGTPGRPRRHS